MELIAREHEVSRNSPKLKDIQKRGKYGEPVYRDYRGTSIPVFEKNFSLTEVYGAEEAFVTGTFAGVAPVIEIDGRIVGDGTRGSMVERLQSLYLALIESETGS